jgi:TetR/AcrR family transcriptional repressor of nem operon
MRGRPREFDREQALDQAMRLFWTQGYEATGVAQLTEAMGIGRQSLYNTFGDKRSLFQQALEHYSQQALVPLLERLQAPGSPLANLRSVLQEWAGLGADTGTRTGRCGCLLTNSSCELGSRDTELSAVLERKMERMEEAFRDCLQRARDAGELEADQDLKALARFLTNTGQGLAVSTKVVADESFAQDVVAVAQKLLDGAAATASS